MAWHELGRRGFYISASPSNSFFYVLTGVHAIHLFGGVVALLYALAAGFGDGVEAVGGRGGARHEDNYMPIWAYVKHDV